MRTGSASASSRPASAYTPPSAGAAGRSPAGPGATASAKPGREVRSDVSTTLAHVLNARRRSALHERCAPARTISLDEEMFLRLQSGGG